jgi:hypothetical protein
LKTYVPDPLRASFKKKGLISLPSSRSLFFTGVFKLSDASDAYTLVAVSRTNNVLTVIVLFVSEHGLQDAQIFYFCAARTRND